jgi:hypothetical protein
MSAVVPAFNRADVIAATIDSLLAQRVPFSEIVVIDDGSTDATREVVGSYGGMVRLVSTPNRGVQHARNLGAAVAASEWITFCDSDDLLANTLSEVFGQFIGAHGEYEVLYCNFATFGDGKPAAEKLAQAPRGYFDDGLQLGNFMCDVPHLYHRMLGFQPLFMSGLTIRRDTFQRIGGFDERLRGVKAEDWEFTLRAVATARTAVCLKPLAQVRKHPGNDSADAMLMKLGEVAILEHALLHHAIARQYVPEILASIDARRANAFDAAFSRGEFALALELMQKCRRRPRDLKSRLKQMILQLPQPLRAAAWRATQA